MAERKHRKMSLLTELKISATRLYKDAAPMALQNILKGFHLSAQRCRDEGAATLGGESQSEIYSEGVESNRGSGDATALRLMICLDDDPGQSLRSHPGLNDLNPAGILKLFVKIHFPIPSGRIDRPLPTMRCGSLECEYHPSLPFAVRLNTAVFDNAAKERRFFLFLMKIDVASNQRSRLSNRKLPKSRLESFGTRRYRLWQ